MVATCRKPPANANSSSFSYELEDKNGWVWATDMTATVKGYVPVTYARLILDDDTLRAISNKAIGQVSCPRTSNVFPRKKSNKTRVDAGRQRGKTEGDQTTTNSGTHAKKTKASLYIAGPKPRPPPGHMSHASGKKVSNRVHRSKFSSRKPINASNVTSNNLSHIAGITFDKCDTALGRTPSRDHEHGLGADRDTNLVRKIHGSLFL